MLKSILSLSFVLFLSSGIFSQIVIDKSDFPAANTLDTLMDCSLIQTVDYEPSGPHSTWDFSDISVNSTEIREYLNPFLTEFPLPLLFFDATYSLEEADPINQGFEEVSIFHKTSSSNLSIIGLGGVLDGNNIPLRYLSPDIVYEFPLMYKNKDTSESSLILNIPNTNYFERNQLRTNIVDGFGSLALPDRTYEDVLRVKSTISKTDTTYFVDQGFGLQIDLPTVREYKWLGKGYTSPLLEIKTNEILGLEIVTYIKYLHNPMGVPPPPVSIGNESDESFFSIYPNPCSGKLNWDTNIDFTEIRIVNTLGETVRIKHDTGNSLLVEGLSKGVYHFHGRGSKGEVTETFIIN